MTRVPCYYKLPTPYTNHICVNRQCECNMVFALHNRHLQTNEHMAENEDNIIKVKEAFAEFEKYHPPTIVKKLDLDGVVARAPLSKRKLYRRAAAVLKNRALRDKDYEIKSFIKNERADNVTKPPRLIQARGPVYCVAISQFLTPIEDRVLHKPDAVTISLKGKDQRAKARILKGRWDKYATPVAVLADHSRYDSRQWTGWLKCEHDYYLKHYDDDDDLRDMLSQQLITKGKVHRKVHYSVIGTRLSGERNTSLGNSINNAAKLYYITRHIENKDVIVEGDDSIIFMDASDLDKLDLQSLNDFGFNTTVEYAYTFEKVSFCQCQPVETINGWEMIRNPIRMMSRTATCINYLYTKSLELTKRWYHTVGIAEQHMNRGVPVTQAWADKLASLHSKEVTMDADDTYIRKSDNKGSKLITNAARLSFCRAFNISVSEQLRMEKVISDLKFDFNNVKHETDAPIHQVIGLDELGLINL